MEERIKNLEGRVSELEKNYAVNDVLRSSVEKRLSSIEDTLKWLVRLVIGGIATALLAFIMGGGLNGV